MNDWREMAGLIDAGLPLDGSDRPERAERNASTRFGMNKNKHVSQSLGVHPSQAKEFTEDARTAGNTGVEYDAKTGVMTYGTRKDQAKEATRRGMFNRDAGYGDAQPNNL